MKQTEKALSHTEARPAQPGQGNTGVKTEDLKELDQQALDDPKLITTVEERLANLGEMTRSKVSGRRNPAAESDYVEDDDDDSPTPEPKKDGLAEEKPKDDDGSEHQLPDAYLRAAIMYGWKKEDALDFFSREPERALVVFQNTYNTRNKASADFAAIGRRAKETQTPADEPVVKIKPVDTSALKEKYGDDAAPFIEMIEAQNKVLEQMANAVSKPKVEERPKVFESQAEENFVEQQIHAFFEADGMKPYENVYGRLDVGQIWDDLTPGQNQHRWAVLQKADQIIGGATLQGVKITLPEALEAAHLLVTQKFRDQILVDGLRAKAERRAKSFTLKPSDGTRSKSSTVTEEPKPGTRTREQLLADTQAKLTKLWS